MHPRHRLGGIKSMNGAQKSMSLSGAPGRPPGGLSQHLLEDER